MPRRPIEQVEHARHPGGLDLGRAADVAVVEADDAEAALGQHPAELLVPGDHLRRQAHHQQQRLPVGVAHLLVAELDPVGGRELLVTEAMHLWIVPILAAQPNRRRSSFVGL